LAQEIDGNVPRWICTDPVRVRQILTNLVGNAVKFTQVGGVRVVVRLNARSEAGVRLQFDVVDTGIGLSEKEIGLLFRPFSQADASTTRRFGGTGLGLAISKELSRLLQGRIEIDSDVGRGATFSLIIPLTLESKSNPLMPAPPAAPQPAHQGA
jgi:signal transduction histidine kinase